MADKLFPAETRFWIPAGVFPVKIRVGMTEIRISRLLAKALSLTPCALRFLMEVFKWL
jgi:hypothetical protein